MSWLDKYRDDPLFKSDGSALKSDDPVSFITVIFFILLIIFIFYLIIYIYGYFYEPNKKISSFLWGAYGRDSNEDTPSLPVDTPKAEQMTAQEYNKKADAQMEAIRSGRSDYKETSTKGIPATKDPYGRKGRLYFVMLATGLLIGLIASFVSGFENITDKDVLITFVLILLYAQLYFMLGHVGKDEFIEKGWYKKDASIFQEILMSPIFITCGVFFMFGMMAVAVVMFIPVAIIGYYILIMLMGF
jgi:hypothetical protein